MRFATVGCGWLATRMHGPARRAYLAARPAAHWVACCDLDEARARHHVAAFGAERALTEIDAMLAETRPDAVIVAVPVELTASVVARILQAGFPALTEKPPGLTVAEVDALRAAAEAGRTVCAVAFNRRGMPLVRAARERYDPAAVQQVRYELNRVGRRDPDFGTTAIHGYDLVPHLAGSPFADVSLTYHPLPAEGDQVHNCLLTGTFASGATCQLEIAPCCGVLVERATIHLADRTLLLKLPAWGGLDGFGRLEVWTRGELTEVVEAAALVPGGEDWIAGGFAAETADFLDAVAAGRPPSPSLDECRPAVALMELQRRRAARYSAGEATTRR